MNYKTEYYILVRDDDGTIGLWADEDFNNIRKEEGRWGGWSSDTYFLGELDKGDKKNEIGGRTLIPKGTKRRIRIQIPIVQNIVHVQDSGGQWK